MMQQRARGRQRCLMLLLTKSSIKTKIVVATAVIALVLLLDLSIEQRMGLSNNTTSSSSSDALKVTFYESRRQSTSRSYSLHQEFRKDNPDFPSCDVAIHPNDVDVTIVTHCSPDRLWLMQYHCQRWGKRHKYSIAIAIGDSDDELDIVDSLNFYCGMRDIAVQVLHGHHPSNYPINVLRNLAMERIDTSHFLLLDIDFLPAADLYTTVLTHQKFLASDWRNAIVVPVFEATTKCNITYELCQRAAGDSTPIDRDDIVQVWTDSARDTYGIQVQVVRLSEQDSTNYRAWKHQSADELVAIPCIKSPYYDPYLVVRKCSRIPPFPEAFGARDRGNKFVWSQLVLRMGLKLSQISSFAVHFPHLPTAAMLERVQANTKKMGMAEKFERWFGESVPNEIQTPFCHPRG